MILYMVGKLAPNSSHLTRGLVKHVPGRGYFRAVPFHNGDKYVTSPPPPIVGLVTLSVKYLNLCPHNHGKPPHAYEGNVYRAYDIQTCWI